jgi:hypothetical protein
MYCWWECWFVQSLPKAMSMFLKKNLKMENYPFPRVCSQRLRSLYQRDTYTDIFIVALVTSEATKVSIDEQIKKMWYTCTIEYYSGIKNMILSFQLHGWGQRTWYYENKPDIERQTMHVPTHVEVEKLIS